MVDLRDPKPAAKTYSVSQVHALVELYRLAIKAAWRRDERATGEALEAVARIIGETP